MAINAEWHKANRRCGCREMPQKIAAEVKKRGLG